MGTIAKGDAKFAFAKVVVTYEYKCNSGCQYASGTITSIGFD